MSYCPLPSLDRENDITVNTNVITMLCDFQGCGVSPILSISSAHVMDSYE